MLSIEIPWNSDFPLGIRRNPQELMEESKDLRLVLTLHLRSPVLETTLQNIQSTEKHYYPTLNSLELLSIIELSMKLGSYHTNKFSKGLNLVILTRPMQPTVQCSFWNYFLFSIMRRSLRKSFLMLPFQRIRKLLGQNYPLLVLCWTEDYFLLINQVLGIILSLERDFSYYCHSL